MEQYGSLSEEDLSPRQIAALPHLASARSATEAARRAGIGRTTLYRWLSDPAFRQHLATLREEIDELTRAKVKHMAVQALQVIQDSFDNESSQTRLRAAIAALDVFKNVIRDQDVDRRLGWLEDSLALKDTPRW